MGHRLRHGLGHELGRRIEHGQRHRLERRMEHELRRGLGLSAMIEGRMVFGDGWCLSESSLSSLITPSRHHVCVTCSSCLRLRMVPSRLRLRLHHASAPSSFSFRCHLLFILPRLRPVLVCVRPVPLRLVSSYPIPQGCPRPRFFGLTLL